MRVTKVLMGTARNLFNTKFSIKKNVRNSIVVQKENRLLLIVLFLMFSIGMICPNLLFASSSSIVQNTADLVAGSHDANTSVSSSYGVRLNSTAGENDSLLQFKEPDYFLPTFFDGTKLTGNQIVLDKSSTLPLSLSPFYTTSFVKNTGLVFDGNLMYISNTGDAFGVSLIDTKGTTDFNDDELLYRYGTSSNPKLPSNNVLNVYKSGNFLYICSDLGLTILDTHGTADPSDDQTIQTYSFGYTYLVEEIGGIVYAATGSGFVIEDIGDPANIGDDALIKTYSTSSAPNIAGTSVHSFELSGSLAYICTDTGGLSLLDIGDPLNISDDSLIKNYSTVSTPTILSNSTNDTVLEGSLLYISTSNNGISVLDIADPLDPNDDSLYRTYTDLTTPALLSNYVSDIIIDSNNLYVSTDLGLSVIDLTTNQLVSTFTYDSDPQTYTIVETMDGESGINGSYVHDGLIYAMVGTKGTSVISLSGYLPNGVLNRDVLPMPASPVVSWTGTQLDGQTTSLRTRTGETGQATNHDFNVDTSSPSEYKADKYSWGYGTFDTAVASDGTLKMTNPSNDGEAVFWLDAEPPSGVFPAGSNIFARMRINSDTAVIQNWSSMLAEENYSNSSKVAPIYNDWQTVRLVASEDFKYVGIDLVWDSGTWSSGDSLEIDWLKVTEPVTTQHIDFGQNVNPSLYDLDPYLWGHSFGTKKEIGGNLVASIPNPDVQGDISRAYLSVDTGHPSYFYPKGTLIRTRLRINSTTRENVSDYGGNSVFTDDMSGVDLADFSSDGYGTINNNEWIDVVFPTEYSAFSKVGFDISYKTGTWDPNDSVEVDFVDIISPQTWGEWSTPCIASSGCAIPNTSGKSVFQYSFSLQTPTPVSTPTIDTITIGANGYVPSGTYLSSIADAGKTVNWRDIVATTDLPESTIISYRTRSGDSSMPDGTWSDWESSSATILSPNSRYLQYEAVLATSDTSVTPTLSSVVINYDDVEAPVLPPTTSTETTKYLHLVSGNNQSVTSRNANLQPLVVQVLDQDNNPLSGIQVGFSFTKYPSLSRNYSVTAQGGSQYTNSDSNGMAYAYARLGDRSGDYVVQAATDFSSVDFNLAYHPQYIERPPSITPTFITIISGNNQVSNKPALADPLVVQVFDQNNAPIVGATIDFGYTSFPESAVNYSLSANSAVSDSDGKAHVSAILGDKEGDYNISASTINITAEGSKTISVTFNEKYKKSDTSIGETTSEGSTDPIIISDDKGIPWLPNLPQRASEAAAAILAGVSFLPSFKRTKFEFFGFGSFIDWILGFFLPSKEKNRWGVVYDSITRKTVSGATVSVFETIHNQLVESKITDKKGRFFIKTKPGTYQLQALKTGYVFPSVYDLSNYQGTDIVVKEEETDPLVLEVSIDPIAKNLLLKKITLANLFRVLHIFYFPVLLIFTLASIYALYLQYDIRTVLVISLYTIVWIFEIAKMFKNKTYGRVVNLKDNKPEEDVVVRLFNAEDRKLIDTKISNEKGQFVFFLNGGSYVLSFSKEGFQSRTVEHANYYDEYFSSQIHIKKLQ